MCMAVTANGRVYQWGLVHKDASGDPVLDAAAGQLVNLAQDSARNETLRLYTFIYITYARTSQICI
jgi:hypothetical protein